MGVIVEKKLVEQEIVVGYDCDICKRNEPEAEHVCFQHSAWGNDSIDSLTCFYICSSDCYLKFLEIGLKELEDYQETASIDGKSYKFVQNLVNSMKREKENGNI